MNDEIQNFHLQLSQFFVYVIQLTSTISNTRYLELSLSRTFSLVPSAFLVTFRIITFGISNAAILNFHYVEQIFRFLQLYYPASRTFSSRGSIFKENSSKTLRLDRMFIFLCSFIIIRTFFYTTETRCLSSESLM